MISIDVGETDAFENDDCDLNKNKENNLTNKNTFSNLAIGTQ